jgi:hypothetical protein
MVSNSINSVYNSGNDNGDKYTQQYIVPTDPHIHVNYIVINAVNVFNYRRATTKIRIQKKYFKTQTLLIHIYTLIFNIYHKIFSTYKKQKSR